MYVDLRLKTSKAGNDYLFGGKNGIWYRVMKNKEGKNVLAKSTNLDEGFKDIDTLTAKSNDRGPYEFGKNQETNEVFFLTRAENAGKPIFYSKGDKAGEPVMKKDGTQLIGADFTLNVKEGIQ